MITVERQTQRTVLQLDAHIDLTDAEEMRRQILEAIGRNEMPMRLDLSGDKPTVPVLQLVLSARQTLVSRNRFDGFGPNAARALEGLIDGASEPEFTSVRSAA